MVVTLSHTKQCISCLEFKSLDNFGLHNRSFDGLKSKCKFCTNVLYFWRQVVKSRTCWIWSGHQDKDGYGKFGGRVFRQLGYGNRAHRISWILTGNPVDPTKVLDHKCRNRQCVNPDHLQQITSKENTLLGKSPAAFNKAKTHCIAGHELTENNLYIYTKEKHGRNKRVCKTCTIKRQKQRRKNIKFLSS